MLCKTVKRVNQCNQSRTFFRNALVVHTGCVLICDVNKWEKNHTARVAEKAFDKILQLLLIKKTLCKIIIEIKHLNVK